MCRHLAYLGPPCAVGELLTRGPHSLQSQGWAPRDMRGGATVNADGYGAAWWVDGAPVRYRCAAPVWTDVAGAAVLGAATSAAVLLAVRSATVGMAVQSSANAPFTDGRWVFSHNGRICGWPDTVAELAGALPVTDLLTLDAPTDSALLWALLRPRLAQGAAPAVAGLVAEVAAAAPGSRLNLLLTDGEQIVATTYFHSLSVLVTDDAVVVASEPYDDDPAWQPVPEYSLLTARAGHAAITPLDL